MGRPKMLLPWGESSVLGHLINLWSRVLEEQIVVVCADGDAGVENELNRLGVPKENRVVNPQPERGMFSSVQCAAQWRGWRSTLTHWTIALGDQPQLQLATLQTLADFAREHPAKICQPGQAGHGRHPIIFPRNDFQSLAQSKAHTLKEFLEARSADVQLIEVDDPGLDVDLDEPADYESALKTFRAGH